jgi:hypothetical protein
VIGDSDPEDWWDDGDSVDEKLHVLEKLVESLRREQDERYDLRRFEGLRLAEKVEDDDRGLDWRQRRRLRRIRDELD